MTTRGQEEERPMSAETEDQNALEETSEEETSDSQAEVETATNEAPPPAPVDLLPGPHDAHLRGVRGATIGPIESSQHPGVGYGTEASARTLDYLSSLGVNWISITPFGRIWSLSSTEIVMDFEAPYEDNRRAIAAITEQAHARNMRVLLVPHLWVETEGWRGEIDPGSEEGWADYQESYRAFLLGWARDAEAAGVDMLSIGVECKSWSGRFGPVWESMIQDVRETYSGALTYSANWDEAENVLFWDLLDAIGVNAFYPLADHNGASDAEYQAGAQRIAEQVADLPRIHQKPLLFVEVGYTTRQDAAVEPWLWPDNMQNVVLDEHEQARALSASLDAFIPQEWFAGFFLWRYYADLYDISQEARWGFSTQGKLAEEALRARIRDPWPRDLERPSWLPPDVLSVNPPLRWNRAPVHAFFEEPIPVPSTTIPPEGLASESPGNENGEEEGALADSTESEAAPE